MKRVLIWALGIGLALGAVSNEASALPGFFAGKDAANRVSRSTQVVVMKRDGRNVVSVMTDYDGPSDPFAFVMPVPQDVSLETVATLKRAAVERLDELTSPRFHEFWEMDPCEPGKAEQIWERSLVASGDTDFLGTGMGDMFKGSTKAPPEMKLKVEPDLREEGSEFVFHIVSSDVAGWLSGKGFKIPQGVSLDKYAGMSFLVAVVDPEKVELGKRGEALLSAIRYSTKEEVKIASTLGVAHLDGHQELVVYTLHPEKRFEIANYKNVVPPTNLQVDFDVKERMGEYYAAMHDMLLEKDKQAFLAEYAWGTETCGEPCPNAKLALHELLTLGADRFEADLSQEELHPEPPERTEDEEKIYKEKKKDEQEEDDELRTEVARRKALIERQSKFVLTRLHHRYAKDGLPHDVELKQAPPIEGGIGSPQGVNGDLPQGHKTDVKENRLQTRFVHLHPNIKVLECEAPERYRWGKPPRTYRGARKIWVADQLASRDRTKFKPAELTLTAVPELGIKGVLARAEEEAAAKAAAEKAKQGNCDCSLPGRRAPAPAGLSLAALLGVAFLRRRRPPGPPQ
jgi:hypothetical protein